MTISKDDQVKLERELLDNKIQDLEALVKGSQKALFETELKVHATMVKLLASNDVNKDALGHEGRRQNILENMNDLKRQISGFFKNEGISASNDEWREFDSVDRRAEAPVQFSRFDSRVGAGTFQ